jgi:TDG/mug DNA glycosylase family protein
MILPHVEQNHPRMDRATIATYEARSREWIAQRSPKQLPRARAFGRTLPRGSWRADLGCGPGWYAPALGTPVVALDASQAMLDVVPEYAPHAHRVRADLAALPLRRGALGGAWASGSYVHLPADHVPFALAQLHHAVAVGGRVHLSVIADVETLDRDDSFGGRFFSYWEPERLHDVVVGAGFDIDTFGEDDEWLRVDATRVRTLPDTVGAEMRALIVGLNPSVYSADAGVGFARPGNRFWPAAIAAGLVSRPRDTHHALVHHHVGMTDLVKRATPRADALSPDEYRAGAARVERLVTWLQPRAVGVVGLTGWRHAIDRKAVAGWQEQPFGGRPVYVMPNTSGLNARVPLAELARHLRSLQEPPPVG